MLMHVLAERAYNMGYVGLVGSVILQGYLISLILTTNKLCFSKHYSIETL